MRCEVVSFLVVDYVYKKNLECYSYPSIANFLKLAITAIFRCFLFLSTRIHSAKNNDSGWLTCECRFTIASQVSRGAKYFQGLSSYACITTTMF